MPHRSLSALIEDHGIKILLLVHVFFWTFIPALTQHNAPLDVVEGFAWGREWQLGTYKHPPLQSWLLEITGKIFGTSGIGYFGLAALCGGVALWAVYKTARLVSDKTTAFYAAALTESILYFTFLSPEFNPNSLQLMLWALAGYVFASALILKKTRWWILLGFIFAAGFYAKYFMAVCGVSFALFMLTDRELRRWFLRPQPYLTFVVAALLCTPHLIWLYDYRYLPFAYAASRLEQASGVFQSALATLTFVGAQIVALLPPVLLGAVLSYPYKTRTVRSKNRFLIRWLAFAPLVLTVVPSLISGQGLRSMWGVPIVTFVPLWLVTHFEINTTRIKSFALVWAGVFLFVLFSYAGNQIFAADLGFKPPRGHYPGRETAQYFDQVWHEKTTKPLAYVAGDEWEACNVAFYSPMKPRPHVWIYGTDLVSPWIHESDVLKLGAVVVWNAEETKQPDWVDVFVSRFPGTMLQPVHQFKDITIGSAILLPQP